MLSEYLGPMHCAGRHEDDGSSSISKWAKQKETEPARSIGKPRVVKANDAGRTGATLQPVSYISSN